MHRRCCPQAAPSVHYTTSCKHILVLLRMGEIIARNMLSWLKLSIELLYLHLVGCLYYCISDARSHKHQKNNGNFFWEGLVNIAVQNDAKFRPEWLRLSWFYSVPSFSTSHHFTALCSRKVWRVFFLVKITGKITFMWMGVSSYVNLVCFEMRAAGRISVFMSSGVRLRKRGAKTSTTSYVFMAWQSQGQLWLHVSACALLFECGPDNVFIYLFIYNFEVCHPRCVYIT